MNNRKIVTETIDVGDIDISLTGSCVIHEVDKYLTHVEMEIEIVRMGIGDTGELVVSRFTLIDKKVEIYGQMEDGEVYWKEAKAHVRWMLDGFGKLSTFSLDTKKDFYFNESLGKSEVRVWGNSATSSSVSGGDEEDDSEDVTEIDNEVWDTIGKLGRTGYAEERETSARFLGVESDGTYADPLDEIFPIIPTKERSKYRYEESGAIESCECASCVQRRRMHLVDKQWEQRSSDRL